MTPKPASATYRPDIDGLRAVAVGAVVVGHAFPGRLPLGFLGVDVFFVVSGYLITSLLLSEQARGGIRVGAFYARRVRRLFPALLLVLAACLVAGFGLLRIGEFESLVRHTLASLTFVQNFNLAGEVGYFDSVARTKPLLHLWTLAVEEQFYVVWPALLLLVGPSLRRLGALVLGVVAASLIFGIGGLLKPEVAYYWLPTRA